MSELVAQLVQHGRSAALASCDGGVVVFSLPNSVIVGGGEETMLKT